MQSLPRIPVSVLLFSTFAAVILTTAALSPAAGTGAEGITTFSGTSSGPIAAAINSGNGVAFSGRASNQGIAVEGVIGAGNAGIGVRGVTYGPGSAAVVGEAKSTAGNGSTAVLGNSAVGNGIIGTTKYSGYLSGVIRSGVMGQDLSTNPNSNSGVRGISTHNVGVYGQGGIGVFGSSSQGTGVKGQGSVGLWGTSNDDLGLYAQGAAGGIVARSTNGSAIDALSSNGYGLRAQGKGFPAVAAFNYGDAPALYVGGGGLALPRSGFPIVIIHSNPPQTPTCGSNGSSQSGDVVSIDEVGNIVACGTVTTGTPPLIVTRRSGSANVATYAPQLTEPAIEDLGQGRLVNGQAYVALESRFAATIDARAHYLVFLTPYGDNRGLYVAQQTHAGFLVRESQGGRSTLAFDYRIVAKPYDTNAPRLPLASTLPHPRSVALPPPIRGRPQFRAVPRLR